VPLSAVYGRDQVAWAPGRPRPINETGTPISSIVDTRTRSCVALSATRDRSVRFERRSCAHVFRLQPLRTTNRLVDGANRGPRTRRSIRIFTPIHRFRSDVYGTTSRALTGIQPIFGTGRANRRDRKPVGQMFFVLFFLARVCITWSVARRKWNVRARDVSLKNR